MQLDMAFLNCLPDVLTVCGTPTLIAAKLLSATTDGRGFEYPFAVKADSGVLLDGRQLLLQRRIVLHQLDHVRALHLLTFARHLLSKFMISVGLFS